MRKMWAFVVRDARLSLSYALTFWMRLASILATVAGLYYMAGIVSPSAHLGMGGKPLDYFTYVVTNLAFMTLLTSAFQAVSQTLRRDQVAGTLEAIFVSPTDIWLIAAASGAWPMLYAFAQTLIYFGFAFVLGLRFSEVNAATLALFLALGMGCMAALGVFAGAMVVRYKQSPPTTFLVGSAASVLSGVLFPIGLFPPAIRAVAWLLPMTHALNGLRAALLGLPPGMLWGDVAWLAVANMVLVPLSLLFFLRAFTTTLREGSLAYY